MSEWILAAERLPDDDTTVLVALDDGDVWLAYMESDKWRNLDGVRLRESRVTHWMDLPAHPLELEHAA